MNKILIFCPIMFLSCSSFEKTDKKIQLEVTTAAVSNMHSTKFPNLEGSVSFEDIAEGIRVKANLTGLPKKTKLGFHIHQVGACEGPDYKSAGDHFNPTSSDHGGPNDLARHFGDLGNLVSDAKGESHDEMIITKTSDTQFEQIIGKSVLIHERKDDLKSQPSGNAGPRIACGIIKALDSIKKVTMGTMSTDQNETSSSEASMSGTTDDKMDLTNEKVQLQEEKSILQERQSEVNDSELKDYEEEIE